MVAPAKFTPEAHAEAVKHNARRMLTVLARNQAIAAAALEGLTAAREAARARAAATATTGGGGEPSTKGP